MAVRSIRATRSEILAIADVGGALVGGASLKAETFLPIIACRTALNSPIAFAQAPVALERCNRYVPANTCSLIIRV